MRRSRGLAVAALVLGALLAGALAREGRLPARPTGSPRTEPSGSRTPGPASGVSAAAPAPASSGASASLALRPVRARLDDRHPVPEDPIARALRRGTERRSTASEDRASAPGDFPPEPSPRTVPGPPSSSLDISEDRGELFLDPPSAIPGFVTVGITGLDTGAPRPLVLWRLADGRRVALARTRSDASGAFVFPQVPLAHRPAELVVAPAGRSSEDPRASRPVRIGGEGSFPDRASPSR